MRPTRAQRNSSLRAAEVPPVAARLEPRLAEVIDLQRSAGNSAVAALLQRQPAAIAAPRASRPRLVRGSRGAAVKTLQQRLNAQGQEPPLVVDGVYGRHTREAVIAFQESHGLEPVGEVGPRTWAALEAAHAARELDPTEEKLGAHAVRRMDELNLNPHTVDEGVHYASNYKAVCERAGQPTRWKEDFRHGFADPQYFDRVGFMDWMLKPRMSASAALKAWLHGPTVAECNVAIVAIETDAIRASMGDRAFDDHFGSTEKVVPESQRLRIKPGLMDPQGSLKGMLVPTEARLANNAGTKGKRPVKPGERYYFTNHPAYLLKHPGGAWQGENAFYMGEDKRTGEQLWSGMGAQRVTEDEMLVRMFNAYNEPRDEDDEARLAERFPAGPPPEYDPANGKFPDKLSSPDEILTAPEMEVNGVRRKGGFDVTAGVKLDVGKVQELAEPPILDEEE